MSSPITCIVPPQQGQVFASGAITTSTRGRCGGNDGRLSSRPRFLAAVRCGSRFSTSAVAWCDGLLDVFERELQLVRVEFFRAPAELHALQLAQQVPQSIVLLGQQITLGQHRVALGKDAAQQTAQRCDVLRQGIGQSHYHDITGSRSAAIAALQSIIGCRNSPESLGSKVMNLA